MGMLVTLYLMLINSHNSVEAPSGRGFSYIEIWFVGTQVPIAFGIIEYGTILALKRFSKISDDEVNMAKFPSEINCNFVVCNFMDVTAFIFSAIYFLTFIALYMIP